MTQHLKPRSAEVRIYQGDDMARLSELKRAVDHAEAQAKERLGNRLGDLTEIDSDDDVKASRAAYDTFVDEAAERALQVVLHSLGRRRFNDLIAAYPPRRIPKPRALPAEGETVALPEAAEEIDHPDDAQWGINTETFPRALLAYRDGGQVTLAQPEFTSDREAEAFIDDELADGDFEQLWVAAFLLNRTPSADPKAARSWAASRSSNET